MERLATVLACVVVWAAACGGGNGDSGQPDAGDVLTEEVEIVDRQDVPVTDVCVPDCEGRECGDNGCGEACGQCTSPDECLDDGTCGCKPDCGWAECGPDPKCGLSCGECAEGEKCGITDKCTSCSAVDCGGMCDACEEGKFCEIDEGEEYGKCKNCAAGQCGDGCGECPEGMDCVEGICEGTATPQDCKELWICLLICEDQNCINNCFNSASVDVAQAANEYIGCQQDACSGVPDDKFYGCIDKYCLEEYSACLTGDLKCIEYFGCAGDCMDQFGEPQGDTLADPYFNYRYKCWWGTTKEGQDQANAVWDCFDEFCPNGDDFCVQESLSSGGECVPYAAACEGTKLPCSDSGDCNPVQFCDGGLCKFDVWGCAEDGSGEGLVEECGEGTCDEGECKVPQVPCESDDECAEAEFCAADEFCAEDACPQDTIYCKEDVAYTCSPNGSEETEVEQCDAGNCVEGKCIVPCEADDGCAPEEYCLDGECVADACEQGKLFCLDNAVQACSANGSTQVMVQGCGDQTCVAGQCVDACEDDTGCAEEGHCADGACVPDLCAQTTTYCHDGDVYVCNANGSTEILLEDCGDGECVDGACQ